MNKLWSDVPAFILTGYGDISQDSAIPWNKLEHAIIFVTGATGGVGNELIKSLLYANVAHHLNLKIIGLARSPDKVKHVFGDLLDSCKDSLSFIYGDLSSVTKIEIRSDYIIHTACTTNSRDFVERPVETIIDIVEGTHKVLEYARSCSPKSVVYLSSMEVYGKLNHEEVCEEDVGFLNILSPRSSYPQGKRLAETLCSSYWHEYKLPVRVIRMTLTFGSQMSESDNRVYAQFIRAKKQGQDIILHTKGETKRDYLYTLDAVRGIITVALLGADGQAYNISTPDSYISIKDLALKVAKISGKGVKVRIEEDRMNLHGYAPTVKIWLNNDKINRLNQFKRIPLDLILENLIFS